jgi:hypothetical protein
MAKRSAEAWRPVLGFEGLYEVSSLGRVRGLKYNKTRDGILRASTDSAGRKNVRLNRDGKRLPRRVHVLVAEAFIGPRPDGMVARHLDDDPANNNVSNIAWGTYSDNARDCVLNGGNRQKQKTHCPQGHPYDEANTIVNRQGHRKCRRCTNAQRKAKYAAKRRAEGRKTRRPAKPKVRPVPAPRKTHCPRGHEYDTVASDGSRRCSTCLRAWNRERMRANYEHDREQILAYQKDYYQRNREKVRAQQRTYRLRKKAEKAAQDGA